MLRVLFAVLFISTTALAQGKGFTSEGLLIVPEIKSGMVQVPCLYDYERDVFSLNPAIVKIGYNSQSITFLFTITKRPDYTPSGTKQHDGPLWREDSIEVLLLPYGKGRTFYHYIVNAAGALLDETSTGTYSHNRKWSGNPKYEVTINNDSWSVRLTIPFSDMNFKLSPSGDNILRCNLGIKSIDPRNPFQLVWCYTGRTLHNKEFFGKLELNNKLPFVQQADFDLKNNDGNVLLMQKYIIKDPVRNEIRTLNRTAEGTKPLNYISLVADNCFSYKTILRNVFKPDDSCQ